MALEKKEAFIQACFEQLCETGFGGASAKKITRRIGVSDTLLFKYFGKLDALYKATLTQHCKSLFVFAMPAKLPSTFAFLQAYLEAFFESVLVERQGAVRLYFKAAFERPDLFSELNLDLEKSGSFLELKFVVKEKKVSNVDEKMVLFAAALQGLMLKVALSDEQKLKDMLSTDLNILSRRLLDWFAA